jgi:excisionase family DNA binding protein
MENLYSLKKVHENTGLSLATLHRYIKSGKLNVVRVGDRAIRVPESEITRLIKSYK